MNKFRNSLSPRAGRAIERSRAERVDVEIEKFLLTRHAPIVRLEIFVRVRAGIAELQRGRNDAAVLLVVAPGRGFDSRLTK